MSSVLSRLSKLAQKGEVFVARKLLELPPSALVALSRRPAIVVDGQTLHPEMQFLLAARALRGGGTLRADSVERARRQMRREAVHYADPVPVFEAKDLTVPGAAGPLEARHYAPAPPGGPNGKKPLLVFFHGGGFVLGDLETHDSACRILCRDGDLHVLSVGYRLAPEHPFPAGVEDAVAATRWALAHASDFGADPARVAVGGDSAGGNLAAVTAQTLGAEEKGPKLALQLLLYPTVDRGTERPSRGLFGDGFLLTSEDMAWFDTHYYGAQRELLRDPRLSPMLGKTLARQAPAIVVTAAFDPLRDEGDAYAAALTAAGVKTLHQRVPGFVHGFANLTDVSPSAKQALVDVAQLVRRELAEGRLTP